VDRIWEDAKARRVEPAIRPEWSVVAGLRDLTNALFEQAMQAQAVTRKRDRRRPGRGATVGVGGPVKAALCNGGRAQPGHHLRRGRRDRSHQRLHSGVA